VQRAVPTRSLSLVRACRCLLCVCGLNRQLLGGRGLRPGASEQSDTYNGNGVISLIFNNHRSKVKMGYDWVAPLFECFFDMWPNFYSEKTNFLGEFKPCFAKPFFRYKKNDIIQNENRDTGTESNRGTPELKLALPPPELKLVANASRSCSFSLR
jgi:hypothetical protein